MQGWPELIPTNKKIDYMNSLMDVGYDILDCGSFVNPRMVPQMADSGEVVDNIDKSRSSTKLSVVIANFRGAEKALEHEKIDYLGFPFSISETFQHRNTNKSREEAFTEVQRIFDLTKSKTKTLFYISLWLSVILTEKCGNGRMWKNGHSVLAIWE